MNHASDTEVSTLMPIVEDHLVERPTYKLRMSALFLDMVACLLLGSVFSLYLSLT